MLKSILNIANLIILIALISSLILIGNIVVKQYERKSLHGYTIYNCHEDTEFKKNSIFQLRKKCEIVEQFENKLFYINEDDVKAQLTFIENYEEYPSQNIYYRIW